MESFIASHWKDSGFTRLEDGEDVAALPVVGLSCCAAEGKLGVVGEWAAGHPNLRFELVEDPYQKGVQVGFLQDERSSKGEALEILLLHLGLQESQATVFGDAANDLSMFQAGRRWKKVAVASAVPEIKGLADLVLGPSDSVLHYIERELAS
jgi:hypothetical protein